MDALKTRILLVTGIAIGFSISVFSGEKPKPKITVDKKVGFLPLLVKFSCNQEADNEIFLWDFGNGNSSLGRIAADVYSNPGIYQVKVVVRCGSEWAVDSVNIEVLSNRELVHNMAKLHAQSE